MINYPLNEKYYNVYEDFNMTRREYQADVVFTSVSLFFSLLLLSRANKTSFKTRVFDVKTRSSLPTERMEHSSEMKILKRFRTDWTILFSFHLFLIQFP